MENKLVHLAEFRQALANYHISARAAKVLSQTKLVLLAGPTSSGRNTIIDKLAKTDDYYHIVSDTTRSLRTKDGSPIEQNGREYWFRSEEQMLADLRSGEYIEAAIIHDQQVSGCNVHEVEKACRLQKTAIKDITPAGAANIYKVKSNTIIIFVLPPSFEEWNRRLRDRTELPPKEVQRRLVSASKELEAALTHDYYQFVINTAVPEAVEQVKNIAEAGHQEPNLQDQARQLAHKLLEETQNMLKNLS